MLGVMMLASVKSWEFKALPPRNMTTSSAIADVMVPPWTVVKVRPAPIWFACTVMKNALPLWRSLSACYTIMHVQTAFRLFFCLHGGIMQKLQWGAGQYKEVDASTQMIMMITYLKNLSGNEVEVQDVGQLCISQAAQLCCSEGCIVWSKNRPPQSCIREPICNVKNMFQGGASPVRLMQMVSCNACQFAVSFDVWVAGKMAMHKRELNCMRARTSCKSLWMYLRLSKPWADLKWESSIWNKALNQMPVVEVLWFGEVYMQNMQKIALISRQK